MIENNVDNKTSGKKEQTTKKVCIVTVYNSLNSGSYWQAKALGDYLGKNNEVFYLERCDKDASSYPTTKLKRLIKYLLKMNIKSAIRECKIIWHFSKLEKGFRTLGIGDDLMNDMDCIVLGSDTIWNLDSNYFEKNYKKYFGGIFGNKRIVAYAPSVANTSITKFKNRPEITGMLKNMSSIAVRDDKTASIVKSLVGIKPVTVCDPTMLLTKEDYAAKTQKQSTNEKYVFLYLFESLSKRQIEMLRQFAKEKGLKIISGAKYLSFADECSINTPDLFLQNMLNADYVITDTFHGTVFSIVLNKDFVVIDRGKDKILDLLSKLELNDKLVDNENVIEKLQKITDYKKVNDAVSGLRNKSIRYLNDSINGKDNNNDEK